MLKGQSQRNSVEDEARAGQAKPSNEQNKQGQSCTFSELKGPLNFAQAERSVESQNRKVLNLTVEDLIDRHQLWNPSNGNNSSKATYTLKLLREAHRVTYSEIYRANTKRVKQSMIRSEDLHRKCRLLRLSALKKHLPVCEATKTRSSMK
ncbi:hypothetical protein F511_08723 [Dorcoceras hygrometricum]|uniref:Uncharacterized protein n=1 Tax=Dorcoceras hygrometricum TaxID=472368 RepID=A0A2Z7AAI6_9LAMI|nr:hypothetical protein F511_08723 [Dorcoceras hygrometricum]